MMTCSWEEAKRPIVLQILRKVELQTLFRMKGCSSTKSGILWDTTKSMKFHQMEPASLRFPRSLIVRAMRGQSATSSTSKQIIMIFRAVTNTIYKTLTKKKKWSSILLSFLRVYTTVLHHCVFISKVKLSLCSIKQHTMKTFLAWLST